MENAENQGDNSDEVINPISVKKAINESPQEPSKKLYSLEVETKDQLKAAEEEEEDLAFDLPDMWWEMQKVEFDDISFFYNTSTLLNICKGLETM